MCAPVAMTVDDSATEDGVAVAARQHTRTLHLLFKLTDHDREYRYLAYYILYNE